MPHVARVAGYALGSTLRCEQFITTSQHITHHRFVEEAKLVMDDFVRHNKIDDVSAFLAGNHGY